MSRSSALQHGQAPGQSAKVLIVDDSVVARGLFGRWVGENPAFTVVGTAADGMTAVRAAARFQPDIVILDLDMPVMDGLTALPEILKVSPASFVLIASSLTARSARLSMQCLALGATDIHPKPDSNRDLTMSLSFREDLMRKLEGLIGANPMSGRARRGAASPAAPATANQGTANQATAAPLRASPPRQAGLLSLDIAARLLVIGASTGGPQAIARVIDDLGAVCDRFPIIIAQHMPAGFTASFAEQLQQRHRRTAREAQHGEMPMPGVIHVAPGGRHLRLDKSDGKVRMLLDDSAPVKFCRPSVDMVFADAALVYGASALAVVLTGMGNDGLEGARLMRQAGARVIAQDEASSVVWGMPGAVSRAGLASHVLGLDEIGPSITAAMQPGARG